MEPVKFKKGDKVRCVDASRRGFLNPTNLIEGEVYVVEQDSLVVGEDVVDVYVEDSVGNVRGYMSDRFEMVSEAQPAQPPPSALVLPTAPSERKEYPMTEGLLDYFPAALAEVSRVSKKGNDQHNPGQPMHHARGKSMDHPNCIVRHLVDRGGFDTDGLRHSAKLAWRALALLQEELEAAGAPLARGARLP